MQDSDSLKFGEARGEAIKMLQELTPDKGFMLFVDVSKTQNVSIGACNAGLIGDVIIHNLSILLDEAADQLSAVSLLAAVFKGAVKDPNVLGPACMVALAAHPTSAEVVIAVMKGLVEKKLASPDALFAAMPTEGNA